MKQRLLALLLALGLLFSLVGLTACSQSDRELVSDILDLAGELLEAESSAPTEPKPDSESPAETEARLPEDLTCDDRDTVAAYIHTYGKLPPNYITKAEAEDLGWEGGSVERYAKGKCIGGSVFGNFEGLLPEKSGRVWRECDIDTLGKSSRGAKRIVYSNDGLIYYTEDHYDSFVCLYGEE